MEKTNTRIKWIDATKGIAIFLMVCGHTGIPKNISDWIWSFHMPLFFIISGILYNPQKYASIYGFIKKRLFTLIVPYIVFSIVVLIFNQDTLFVEWIRSGWMGGCALWFIPVLFFAELYSYLIIRYIPHSFCLVVSIIMGSIGYAFYIYNLRMPYNIDVSFYASMFYLFGFILKSYMNRFEPKFLILIILVLLNYWVAQLLPRTDLAYNQCGIYGLNALNAFLGTIAIISLAKEILKMQHLNLIKNFFIWAGKNTIIIMGLSQTLNSLLKALMTDISLSSYISILRHILLWISLWGFSVIINKYVPFLIGKYKK